MIDFLKGRLVSKQAGFAVVDVGGMGYRVAMPSTSLARLGAAGDDALVYTSLQVREDGISLYGFASEDERFVFEKLKTVSGVGPKVALNALSAFDSAELAAAIAAEDSSKVAKIPGVGKKTAQRIIIDLKGVFASAGAAADEGFFTEKAPSCASDAAAALMSMGFSSDEAQLAIKGYDGADDAGEMIRFALKRLGA